MNAGSNAELRITFSRPRLITREDNAERVDADVQMVYELDSVSVAGSEAFAFIAPIGLLEAEDIKWYLESYYIWPVGLFKERAERIENNLSQWGEQLLSTLITHSSTQAVFQQWLHAAEIHELVLSLQVLPEETADSNAAASRLLGLPWELLYYQQQYLVDHQPPIRIRRRLPNAVVQTDQRSEQTTIRILAASPRPSEAGCIDHRISIKPLIEAIEDLGNKAELMRVHPPTIEQLKHELQQAESTGKPFHVVHFDGHGAFDVKTGRGALCFEHQLDNDKLLPEFVKRVYADELAALLSQYQIPLVFLEACQSGQSENDPNASVAAALLQAGVSSVVAMSHSVLVETARRFVSRFYQQLAAGQRIGTAVLAGRQSLIEDHERINIAGAGMLQMQDWFVPLLHQREGDPRLFEAALQVSEVEKPALRLGDLPDTPVHSFIGRSLELLKLERLLELRPYAVIRGIGGQGKTALAVELAHWLVQSRRFERCAFVSVEQYTHENAVVEVLLHQLVNAEHNLAAEYENDVDKALSAIREVLEQERTLVVVDNMESLLADAENKAVLDVLAKLPEAKLLFTTREPLPEPFSHKACDIELGALSLSDAQLLVMQVMNAEGLVLQHDDLGKTPEEVDDLVNAVGCHARALVLLARELAQRGVTATTANVREIMVELEQRHLGERELSLFASVELSLRRLSPEVREQIGGLAVFQGGGYIGSMHLVLGGDFNQVTKIIKALTEVGLAQATDQYAYIRLDPALPAYLGLVLTDEQRETYQQCWREMMEQLVHFIYQHRSQDAKVAAQLATLELPNLMAYLQALVVDWQVGTVAVELAADMIGRVEDLLAYLNQSVALAQVVAWSEQVVQGLEEWSRARFQHKSRMIDRLLQQGDVPGAFQVAQALLRDCQQAGEQVYAGADYDLAQANILLGRVLRIGGSVAQALPILQEAQQLSEALGEGGVRMTATSLLEQGGCLRVLGQLDNAETAYKEANNRSEKSGDARQVAVGKEQLATTHLFQKRYANAMQGYQEAMELFQQLDEPASVAGTLHYMGMVYRDLREFEQAEQAYRQSMSINSQQENKAGVALTLLELGNLSNDWDRLEQAVGFYWHAVDIYVVLGDLFHEGATRNNISDALIKLKRYDEARSELLRAIECKQEFGHAGAVWNAWAILHNLEQSSGNLQAACDARQKAVDTYLAYRRDGGENHSDAGRLALTVGQAMQQGYTAEIEKATSIVLAKPEQGSNNFLHKLQVIIAGERDLALAGDEDLNFQQAAELILLLEQLEN